MKYKNVKPTTYKGMDYRSMLETRYLIYLKEHLNFDMDYEPEVPGLFGYQPDFVIYPHKERDDYFEYKPIYVEIKPIREISTYYDDPDYDEFREKIKRCWNPKNDLVLFGSNLLNKNNHACLALCHDGKIFDHLTSYSFDYSFDTHSPTQNIGLQLFGHSEYLQKDGNRDEIYNQEDLDHMDRSSIYYKQKQEALDKIETSWNKAWSKLQWKPHKQTIRKIWR